MAKEDFNETLLQEFCLIIKRKIQRMMGSGCYSVNTDGSLGKRLGY